MILVWSLLVGAVLAGVALGTQAARRAPGRRLLPATVGIAIFLFGTVASAIVQLSFYPADSNTFAPLGGTSVVFGSDADLTLAVGSGQSLTVTGTISVDRHVWLPCTYGEQKTITNSTTGGHNILVGCTLDASGAAGTVVTIASLDTNIVNSPDGTNYVLAGGGGAFDAASLVGIPPTDIDGSGTANAVMMTDGGAGGEYLGLIYNQNIASAAAIALSKIANGTAGQMIVENSGATSPAWVTVAGDCTISSTGTLTCTKVNGIGITGTPASGYLPIASSSSTSAWTVVSGDCTLASSGAITCTKVNGITITGTPASGSIAIATSSSSATWTATSGDCTLSSAGAITCTAITGNGQDSYGSGGTQATVTANEIKMGPVANNRIRFANEVITVNDTTTWGSVLCFTPPASSVSNVEADCVAGDFLNDSGTGFQGDYSVFSVDFAGTAIYPGNALHVLSQNGLCYLTTNCTLVPEHAKSVLDGGVSAGTAIAARVSIDAGASCDGGTGLGCVCFQVQGPNTDPYRVRCSVEGVQETGGL